MSDYIIEISGNQPYYVEVSGSTVNTLYNLEVFQTSGTQVNVLSGYVPLSVGINDIPSGYPIAWTTGLLPVSRISGLSTYVVNIATVVANTVYNTIDGGTP